MGLLTRMKFSMDPMGVIKGLVEAWGPTDCKTEKEYEKSLHRYLEENLEAIEVVKQFGSGRVRADIGVDREVFIEIKKGFNSTAKLQRLLGQLHQFASQGWEHVLIIICGRADKNLLAELQKEGAELFEQALGVDFFFGSDTFVIVQK